MFFITFCPCITYVVLFEKSQEQIRNDKINKKLNETTYNDYCEKNNLKLDCCVICTGEFNSNDKVIQLPCNTKHCYHSDCIRTWVSKKTSCPLCRINLISSIHENNNNQIIPNDNIIIEDENMNLMRDNENDYRQMV